MADQPQQPNPNAVDPAQFQEALSAFFQQQFGAINAAEAQALEQNASNQEKIKGAIDQTLAQALLGSGPRGGSPGAVQFPPEVFDLAVALTKQPVLQGPIFAFYQQLQAGIDKAVKEQLERFSELAGATTDGQGGTSTTNPPG